MGAGVRLLGGRRRLVAQGAAVLEQASARASCRLYGARYSSDSAPQRVVPTAPQYPPPSPKAFISNSSHPHFNLSLEHCLLRTRPANEPVLLLYRNGPCIVIGRNQNPWHELDVSRMRALGIKLVRRRSGGGAVYHDLGNTNYSFHVAREEFTRRAHAETVARALNSDPVSLTGGAETDLGDTSRGAYVNERNDICVALKAPSSSSSASASAEFRAERKVSGSAYKITSQRAYHHGTMLLSSNLASLGGALKPSRASMTTKGVASVSSPVINLAEAFASRAQHLNHEQFCQAVVQEFKRSHQAADGQEVEVSHVDEHNYRRVLADPKDELLNGWREMDSWAWTWGQTPEFHHRLASTGGLLPSSEAAAEPVEGVVPLPPFTLDLHVKSGLIQSASVKDSKDLGDGLRSFIDRLAGARYDVLADAPDTFGADTRSGNLSGDADTALRHLGYSSTVLKQDEARMARSMLQWFKNVL